MHRLVVILVVCFFQNNCPAQDTKSAPHRKPNIVFFLVDDLGWTDTGPYKTTFYETPNIDKLAFEGMKFTQAYAACPVCSPSRASLMAGKYPAAMHTTDWFGAPQPADVLKETRAGHIKPFLPAAYKSYLEPGEFTLAEALKKGGYQTFAAGKWHLGNEPASLPEAQGFDRYYKGNSRQPSKDLYALTRETNQFIERNRDNPFFAYVSFYSVHIPLLAREETIARYKVKRAESGIHSEFEGRGPGKVRVVQRNAAYSAMVEEMDDAVGRVVNKLQELKIDNRTIIVFVSDNGGLSTAEGWPTSNRPLKAGKGWLYEGGIRVPLLVRWPGVIQPGSVAETPVISADFYPTLLEAAGLPLVEEQHRAGISLIPVFNKAKLPPRSLFWHYPHYGNQGGSPGSAVRNGEWKLIHWYTGDKYELYNLKNDIGETTNLVEKHPRTATRLKKELNAWLKSVGASFPEPNPNYR